MPLVTPVTPAMYVHNVPTIRSQAATPVQNIGDVLSPVQELTNSDADSENRQNVSFDLYQRS